MFLHLALFPHELLEKIASYLPTNDQFTGLVVCKAWYLPFCRTLYRHITLTSKVQLNQFLNTIDDHGHFVRTLRIKKKEDPILKLEDCVTGAIPLLLRIGVGVTSHQLFLLTTQLPRLNSLYFDPRLWQFINTAKVKFIQSMQQLPPLDHPRQLGFLEGQQQIRMLHLRGADMFGLHRQGKFLAIFKSLSTVTDLTIDGDGMWDTEHVMQFTIRDMEELHACLPNLTRLNIKDAVHFVADDVIVHKVLPTQLVESTLFASIDAVDTWCNYLSKKYPQLTHLHLNLTTHHNVSQQSFTRMLIGFNRLVSLKLHPNMSKQFLDDTTFDKVSSTITTLELGLWQPHASNRFKPHLRKAITYLVIPFYETTMDLSLFQNLVKLEIKCKKEEGDKSMTNVTRAVVAMDAILNMCPLLAHLGIQWGIVTLQQSLSTHPLQTLRLEHVSVPDTNLFTQLSIQCPQLKGLFLRECQGITEIHMPNTQLKYLVLSEISTNHLKLIQQQKNARWYHSYRDKYTFQTRISRLSHPPPFFLSLHCTSITTLLFNGCKI